MPADNSVMIHAQAINLARRLSVQNENDLMQVSQTNKIFVLLLPPAIAKNSLGIDMALDGKQGNSLSPL